MNDFKIENTAKQNINQQYKALIYGGAGVGKTTLIATIKKPLVLLVECGNALISLSNCKIPFVRIKNLEHYVKCLNHFKDDERFDTIVTDSLSEVSLNHIQDLMKDKSNSGNKIHGQLAYGRLLDDFDTIFDAYKACRQDIISFAKQQRFISDENRETFYPLFAGKALPAIMQHKFDAVWSLEKDYIGNRSLRTASDTQYFAKTRTAQAINQQEPADINQLLNKIRGVKQDDINT